MPFAPGAGATKRTQRSLSATPSVTPALRPSPPSKATRFDTAERIEGLEAAGAQTTRLSQLRLQQLLDREARARSLAEANEARALEEHMERLRRCFLEHLGQQGRGLRVTELQAAVAIAAFLLYNHKGELLVDSEASSDAAKAKAAAFMSGRSDRTALKLWDLFKKHECIVLEEPGARGPRRANEEELETLEPLVKDHVRKELLEKDTPAWVTRRSLKAFLFSISGISVSMKSLARLCAVWGLEYGRLLRPRQAMTPKRILARDVAVCQVRRALIEGHTIVCADESYCNVRENREYSIYVSGSPFATFARAQGAGLGNRVCFIHALGEAGLAGKPADTVAIVGNIDAVEPHCETMFDAQGKAKAAGDYHGNFTHDIYMKWIMNRFIPWAKAAHPHLLLGESGAAAKKLILMQDNAPYHVGSEECIADGPDLRFNPMDVTKKVLFAGLQKAGCAELSVEHTFTAKGAAAATVVSIKVPINDSSASRKGQLGQWPNAEETKDAAQRWLMDNRPTVLENDVEYALRTELNGNAFVLWNAPNFPALMPVELAWAQVKAYAGAAWTGKRSLAALAKDVHDALYTTKEAVPGVLKTKGGGFLPGVDGSCPSAAALFRHAFFARDDGAQAHIDASARLRGPGVTLRDLIVPEELVPIVGTKGRNAMLFKQAQLLAAGGAALGEALEEDDEDEESDDGE